jgi:hypothetical protein
MDGVLTLLSGRAGVAALTLVGMGLCTLGVGKVATAGNWLSAPGVLGSLLGVLALVIAGAALTGNSLPLISSERAALMAIAGIIVLKFGIAAVFRLV